MKALTAFALFIILLGIVGLQNASGDCASDYWGDYHSLYVADINHPCSSSDSNAEYNLYGSNGADFDLYVLDTWDNTWYSSTSSSNNEHLSVPIHCGYRHKAYVWSYSGEGSWSVCSPQITFDEGFRQLADSDTAPNTNPSTNPNTNPNTNSASANCASDYWGDYHSLYVADINHPCPSSDSNAEYNLYGSNGADFDLYVLDTWDNTWYSSTTSSNNEHLSVPIHCGSQHRAYVWTYSGEGSWSVCSPQITFGEGFRQLADSDTAPNTEYATENTTSAPVSSELIGRWTLSFDWACDGAPAEDVVIFNSYGTFGDDGEYDKGDWTRDGQSIRWEHDESPNALYRGQIFGQYMSGTMSTTDGQTGCWTASKES